MMTLDEARSQVDNLKPHSRPRGRARRPRPREYASPVESRPLSTCPFT